MPIKTIEIICTPCPKCEQLKPKIKEAIQAIEVQNRVKINYEFKLTADLREISNYSLNPSQLPAVIINGNLEFCGQIDARALRTKLGSIHIN